MTTQSVLNRIEAIVDARDNDGKQCAVLMHCGHYMKIRK